MRTDVPRSPNEPFAGRAAGRVTALIDSAADMFLQHGFEAVSLDDLIARVGGSRRNIYSHFGGKEGLFLATVTSLCEDLAVPLKALHIPRTGDELNWGYPFDSSYQLQPSLQERPQRPVISAFGT